MNGRDKFLKILGIISLIAILLLVALYLVGRNVEVNENGDYSFGKKTALKI